MVRHTAAERAAGLAFGAQIAEEDLFIGPVFTREAVTMPRRARHYVYRSVYVTALMILMCTAWLVLAGTQIIRNVGDMARFGAILFQILAPLQLTLVSFMAALSSASAVSQEKDRRTLILLLMTRLTNSELVLGKLTASLLNMLVMLAAALPVFMLTTLFGGVSFEQVWRVFAVTLATALVAGSLGSTLALWREKTFQTLSMTALILLIWLGFWEALYAGVLGARVLGIEAEALATAFSPVRAILASARPILDDVGRVWTDEVLWFLVSSLGLAFLLNLIAILRVRVWNPSREVRQRSREEQSEPALASGQDKSGGQVVASATASADDWEAAQSGHVDARLTRQRGATRRVWDNPVLWREVCTWAYGRKVLIIRVGYILLFLMAAVGLHYAMLNQIDAVRDELRTVIPAAAKVLAPFFVVSVVIINALAVNAITNERDGQSLDLLLVTDLTPKEFIFGKLGGALFITKEMVILPMALVVYLWARGGLSLEDLLFVLGGLAVMDFFVAMLGVHYGMTYANSRTAIGVSLGTVFFLFLGIVTCMVMMVSFSGSFQTQLAPFLAFILGGGVGLFVALGVRNPSPAIGAASLLLPFATFYAITSFLLQYTMAVFLVTVFMYGFATAAMLMPAIGEFDIAMGRTKGPGEE